MKWYAKSFMQIYFWIESKFVKKKKTPMYTFLIIQFFCTYFNKDFFKLRIPKNVYENNYHI